jgi:L-glyceraldehyde 3-phosphate reductase
VSAAAPAPSWQPLAQRYEQQAYLRCGRSGLRLSAISLGLWHNFGGVDDEAQARLLLRHAVDCGVTHFDLANNYGPPPGSAEAMLGRWLRDEMPGTLRDELLISTKAGYRMGPGPYGDGGSRKYLLDSLDRSLQRLGLPHVDIFYHHRPDPETPLEETMAALTHAVRSGRTRYVGLSNYPAALAREASAWLRAAGTPCLIHQPRYNLLERTPEQGLLQALVDEGVGCIPFSPLAQGLLSDRYLAGSIPADSRAAKPHGFLKPATITPELLARLNALHAVARQCGQPLAGLALRWLLHRPAVCSVLIGASQAAQIDAAVAAVRAPKLSDDELRLLDAALGTHDPIAAWHGVRHT